MDPEENVRNELEASRRDFLRRTAIGGAVAGGVWVAPAMLTLDAANACGTLPCNATTSWQWVDPAPPTNNGYGVGFQATRTAGIPPAQSFALAARTQGTVTITPTGADPNSQIELAAGVYQWRTRTSGESGWHLTQSQWIGGAANTSSFLKTRMGQGTSADAGLGHTITLAFSLAVRDLTFSILDIDAVISDPLATSNYRDVVVVSATGPSGSVSFTTVFQGAQVGGSGTSLSPFYGIGPAAVLDTTNSPTNPGNVTLCFLQPVTSVSIAHSRGYTTVPPDTSGSALFGGQHIGISDLTWCVDPAPGS